MIDELVVNQNLSQCPSLHHQLWPMHRGYGYSQNYRGGYNMPPIEEHMAEYDAALEPHNTQLFVARQWDERSPDQEAALLDLPGVSGLVFSSFRHDNPGPIARGDWTITPD